MPGGLGLESAGGAKHLLRPSHVVGGVIWGTVQFRLCRNGLGPVAQGRVIAHRFVTATEAGQSCVFRSSCRHHTSPRPLRFPALPRAALYGRRVRPGHVAIRPPSAQLRDQIRARIRDDAAELCRPRVQALRAGDPCGGSATTVSLTARTHHYPKPLATTVMSQVHARA